MVSTTVPLSAIKGLADVFEAEHGGPPVDFPAIRHVVVRATDEAARELAAPFLNPAPAPAGSSPAFVPEVDTEGAYLIGSPETVIDRLRAHAAAGISHCIFRPQRPGLTFSDAKETLRILASDVMPAFAAGA